ncbi:transmembrane protein 176A [Austrofundulus limnaeus]|uniref:Transmembrane protein 176A-like n=1 Tax=Austrofundulus limnaeus TaxID=52670 RepID=A0A2I4CJC3_AUSLI|nr:PREDICTED: transmembrane protein 176A-like [Austrofundulus limnaeus]XP_013880092.1 PREDICTED: transmembrane protein 176A-like [Austrofundulus limnaeus]
MSLTMNKADGVTVFTLTSDPGSRWPPLCQILRSICCSPVCCSVSEHLRRIQRSSLSVLGALQIIVGLLSIGLGAIIYLSQTYVFERNGFPFWLGSMFILFGIVSILSEKYPSPCLVILNVVLNLAGVAFAITAVVLYIVGIAQVNIWWSDCDQRRYWSSVTQRPSPGEEYYQNTCLRSKNLILMLVRSLWAVLIVLSVLELCVVISSVVLGIKALKSSDEEQNKSCCDSEQIKALLEEV